MLKFNFNSSRRVQKKKGLILSRSRIYGEDIIEKMTDHMGLKDVHVVEK